ncbi:PhzF family phenazine biosynthesis protein [Fretibacter rubidus]|uniref:PhzF family phenazine biosynthesis protein n=1 Tax=Fretibacter rubidus TaxID=570162 RepID=UPI00352B13BC
MTAPFSLQAMFQVDAFASELFTGNPAAVIKRDDWLPREVMQKIAAENNLSETVFIVARSTESDNKGTGFDLRWFTPTLEIDFCGHATIAAAHILATEYGLKPPFTFRTKIGGLSVIVKDGLYILDAPIAEAMPVKVSKAMQKPFDGRVQNAFTAGNNLYLVMNDPHYIATCHPDMGDIIPLSDHGVGITAKAPDDDTNLSQYDCVSRFFVPAEGIDEDPVTGSAHAAIGPYWMDELRVNKLRAYQASKRGGVLTLSRENDSRIAIAGHAVTYLRGEIVIPTA